MCIIVYSLTIYSKIGEERDELKRKKISKKEPVLQDLENSQPIHFVKNEKACFGENTKGMARQSLHEGIMHGLFSHLSKSQE